MLCQILHIYLLEIAPTGMQSQKSSFHSLYFKTLEKFTTEMQTGGRRHDRTLFLRIYALIPLGILRFSLTLYIFRQWCLSQSIERLLEFIVGSS